MKRSTLIIAALTVTLVMLTAVQTAFAVGTPAGTVIQSRSRVVFTTASGAVSDTVYSNFINFTVAQVAAINMTPATNASTTAADSVFAEYPLTITNSGNGSDFFRLSSTSSKSWTGTFYHDANGDGVLQGGEISSGAITSTASINADDTYKIMVRIFVPRGGSLNGQTDTTVVTAKSNYDSTKFNTAQVRTTVNTVNFANIGSALTVTPTNPTSGQNVVYSLSLTNTGSVSATGVTFTDLINTSLFGVVSGTTTQGTFNGGTVPATWTVGTIAAGATVTVTITLNVNSGLANGTPLTNVINVNYTVGGNTFTVTTNNPYAAVGIVRGVQISPLSLSSSKEQEDTLVYALTVKNTGNAKDILEMSFSSNQSFSWLFFKDVNASGTLDGGDTQLLNTATSTNPGVDVDSVAATDSVKILARLIVPEISEDELQELAYFRVESGADNSKFATATATSVYNIPLMNINRQVNPSGDQPPGQEMTFIVSYQNQGHGTAYNVTVTETEPDSMSYVANSVTINDVAKTDAADADEVTVTTVSGRKVISVSLGVVNPLSAEGTIRYRATIH